MNNDFNSENDVLSKVGLSIFIEAKSHWVEPLSWRPYTVGFDFIENEWC